MAAPNSLVQSLIGAEGLIAPQKPRDLFTSLLLKNALSNEPVQHWTQGANRVAQALLGGLELRGQEADETARRAAPDEIANIRGGPVSQAPAAMPAPAMSPRPQPGPPASLPQNVAAPVPQNDPTMTPSPRQVAMANGGQPSPNFNERFSAASAPAPAPVAQPQVPSAQTRNEVSDEEITRMRRSGNPYVKAYGNQLFMAREAERAKLNEPEYGVVGRDQYGNDRRGWIDKRNRTVTPTSPEIPSFVDTKKLRDEVRDLPSYKNLAQAAPVYQSMFEAAGRDNRAADVNLIYGMAKIMDPGSVVRESEMTVAQAVATLPQQLQSTIMSQLNSTGRLSPEVRAAIMQEARSRVTAYQGVFDTDMGMYRGIAQSGQFNPAHVIPTFGPFEQFSAPPPAAAGGAGGQPEPAPARRPRARNAQGQVIEFDGQQWVPVQ